MQPYERAEKSKKQIIVNNFLGGVAWGIGATIGLAIFLAIVGFVISKVDLVPVIGNIISAGIQQAVKNSPNFIR